MVAKLLIYKILQLFCMMLIGIVIAKLKIVTSKESSVLSKISLYLLMPSAIINAFDFEQTPQMRTGLLFAFGAALLLHILLYLLDWLYGRFVSKSAVERASVMYSNAGNLIIPIVSFALGEEWVVFSTAFMAVQLVFVWSHGIRLFSSNEAFNIKKVLLNVNIIAIMIGLVLTVFSLRLPVFVKDITSSFGGMLGPVSMLIAGILAADIKPKQVLADKRIYRVVALRTLVYPVITGVVLKLLSQLPVVDGDKILLIAFLACITPAAATVTQLAQLNHKEPEFATAINIFSTVVCVATMPLFVAVFTAI
ncbi:MAG: AEC family transporter [Clostridia bacterium]|nr:AEC family transporter [Clostridia bacterium]